MVINVLVPAIAPVVVAVAAAAASSALPTIVVALVCSPPLSMGATQPEASSRSVEKHEGNLVNCGLGAGEILLNRLDTLKP